MSDRAKTAAETAMKGGGYYSQSTRGAKDVIDNAFGMVAAALAEIPDPPPGAAVSLADFGASDGGTSKAAIGQLVAACRDRWPGRQIAVTYTDLASNDWSHLFRSMQGLDGSSDAYWAPGNGVFVQGVGIGFHHQLLPDRSLDLGFSATAMHYVVAVPCRIPDHVHHVGATGAALAAFDRQAAEDWERILLARAAELRPGGRLVIASFGKDEQGRYLGNTGGVNMFDTFWQLWQRLGAAGTITADEVAAATFAQVYRTPEEFTRPLTDPDAAPHKAGLRLVSAHTGLTPCPYRAAFDADPSISARAFAKSYIPTLRSWSETVFAQALDPSRPAEERAAIVDAFYQSYEDLVAENPDGHAMDYIHSYLTIEKTG